MEEYKEPTKDQLTAGEVRQIWMEKVWQLNAEIDKEKEKTLRWRIIAAVIAFFLVCFIWENFATVEWRPNFDDNSILCFRRSWWGQREQMVVCQWRKDADPDRDPNYGWCTKYSDGKWHIFYAEWFDQLVLNWPR